MPQDSPQFFFSHDDVEYGPVPATHLRKLAASHQLRPSDKVRRQGTTHWVPASSIQGLYPPPSATNARPPETAAGRGLGPASGGAAGEAAKSSDRKSHARWSRYAARLSIALCTTFGAGVAVVWLAQGRPPQFIPGLVNRLTGQRHGEPGMSESELA
jgi:hypothetical protein